jgi:DNA repair protein RadA/Sms
MASRKSGKYICVACDSSTDHFAMFCDACGSCETVVHDEEEETYEMEAKESYRTRQRAKRALHIDTTEPRFVSTGRAAWDTALGGGFVLPSSVLVPGPAGVGKTTSLLRIADYISTKLHRPVLYGSAEMPGRSIRMLGNRLGLEMKRLFVNDSGRFEDMHDDIAELRPALVVWDSLQRFRVDERIGVVEVRSVLLGAIEAGNRVDAVTIFTSHVNKEEDFSGENSIGHDVDAVLWLRKIGPNLISVECPVKNRNGPTPMTATEPLYSA